MKKRALGLTFMTLVALATAGETAQPPAQDETPAASDPLVLAVEQHAGEDEYYAERIEEYRTAQGEGTSLTDEQKRRYSNAHVYSGCLLYQQADAEGAADAFRQAATIDETNPLPLYCLGLLYRKHNNPKSAVENLYAAAKLGEPLRDTCAAQLKEIVASVSSVS